MRVCGYVVAGSADARPATPATGSYSSSHTPSQARSSTPTQQSHSPVASRDVCLATLSLLAQMGHEDFAVGFAVALADVVLCWLVKACMFIVA